jgi:hypothetical protein
MEPHPYALLLPSLTDEEYAALKADISEHGILYPVIIDEDDRVLDGVHRVRIAAELGIDPPVQRHTGLDDDRKLHLAVGLNMRRRHLDPDRRRELVRSLHDEQAMSVRAIASVTGWSKSTVDRDLRTSPFEQIMAEAAAASAKLGEVDGPPAHLSVVVDGLGMLARFAGWADGQWKRGNWPPEDPVEYARIAFANYDTVRLLGYAAGWSDERPDLACPIWDNIPEGRQREQAVLARDHGLLEVMMGLPRGDAGVDHGDGCPWCVSQMGHAS